MLVQARQVPVGIERAGHAARDRTREVEQLQRRELHLLVLAPDAHDRHPAAADELVWTRGYAVADREPRDDIAPG
ncbi:hypothetical protein C1J01_07035 [Nonomuraea aridisoli]|uniref:Uncharacterized protein n=1 Tax=Nonomuraea aridisoli TaxID=2070368 RepID=A0A2W2EAB0_9ACTN|nr:hypothetical protein C1J01_07035 [Nonomuraea aridisoli]